MKLTHEIHGRVFLVCCYAFLYLIIIFTIFTPSLDDTHGSLGWAIVIILYTLFLKYDIPLKLAIAYQRLWNLKDR